MHDPTAAGMHPPQRKPSACFTAAAMQVVRELGPRGEIETHTWYNYTRRDVYISNVLYQYQY